MVATVVVVVVTQVTGSDSSSGTIANVVGSVDGVGAKIDAISLIDLSGPRPAVIDSEIAGVTVEGVRMSGNERYIAVTVTNGTNMPHTAPTWQWRTRPPG